MAEINELELVLLPTRARKVNTTLYAATLAVKGTEKLKSPQIIVYCSNTHVLQTLLDHHNKYVALVKKGIDMA